MNCFRFLKVFFTLVAVFSVLFLTCFSAGAVFYEEDESYLLDTAGVYGGIFVYFDTYSWINWANGNTQFVLWIPENYKDYFTSDDNALVNMSSSTINLRAYDWDGNIYTVRAPAYSYLQIRSGSTPYTYHDCSDMDIIDTNLHVNGSDSPFYNSNLDLSIEYIVLISVLAFGFFAVILFRPKGDKF